MVPPVVGAIIGFVTNVVAIRMLFRPLKEVRIFGIRIPFTPGILPKQRYRLAQNIGGMVERELLTAEIIRKRLAREDVRIKIKNTLSVFTEKILDKTPGELLQGQENYLSQKTHETAEKMYPVFVDTVVEFLRRNDIRRELEARGRIYLKSIILQLNVFQRFFISAGQYDLTLEEKMRQIINQLIANSESLLQDAKTKNMLIAAVTVQVGRAINREGQSIGMMLGIKDNKKKELDTYLFNKLMSGADTQIENLLETINIKNLVSERIDSLDMIRVEHIILDIMANQFKWINIFGGILGFLIGSFQVLFTYFLG
jgi:uncharacterized membrane protein YheB (UPF0754 family)